MKTLKNTIIKYVVSVSICGILCMLYLMGSGYSSATEPVEKYRLLTDAFSIPGIIFIMVGCLVFVSTSGFFDMLSYALGRFGRSMLPMSKKRDETFYEYKTRKSEERFSGYAFIFITGIAFLIVSAVFMILFFSVYQ